MTPALALPWRAFARAWSGWFARAAEAATRPGEPAAAGAETDPDHASMARLAEGETEALRPIFDRWKLPLISYFYRSLGSRADAEDLALQVFERVYRAAPRYRPDASFSSWLFAIARRELLHEWRRRRRKPVQPVAPEDLEYLSGVEASDPPEGRLAELEEALLEAMRELPERQRSALLLASAGELPHADIARAIGVSENNLNVILHRARKKLRGLFHP